MKCTEHIWLCCQSKNTIPQCVSSTRDTFLQFLISINFLQYIISYYVQTKKEDTQMAKKESPPRKILRCFPETTYTQNYSAATKWKSGQLTIYSTQRYLYILWILIHICEKSLTKWFATPASYLWGFVQMSAWRQVILTQHFCDFPRAFHAFSGIMSLNMPRPFLSHISW